MPQAPETLADRWTLVEKIDEGAMGEVYRATHAVLGHEVAVKVLVPGAARDRAAVDRFLREARIAARLQHRHVVRVEDFGVAEDGRPFLVMELLRGESLAKRLARDDRPSHDEVLSVVRQIAEALDAAHAAGIIHRDLKPENIFLARGPAATVVKVLDFGVAKFTDVLANGAHATASNTLVGTPRYMSPEQARSSRELDGRSDLWALAMIAYEMLTGAHPFAGEAIAELLVAILTHRIAPPSSLDPALPPEVDDWASRALARSRYERYATGAELVDALASSLCLPAPDAPRPAPPKVSTLRVPRPEVQASPDLKRTPLEGPSPVTVPVRDDARDEPRAPTPSRGRLRASWALGAVAALVASATLILGVRASLVARAPSTRPAPAPAVTVAPAAPPRAPSPAAPAAQPDASVRADPSPAAPAAVAPAEVTPAPRRSRARSRRRPGGLYDPSAI